jgi:hypothetical protein
MSAEHYDWIRTASRRAHRTSRTATVVINTVERGRDRRRYPCRRC